MRAVSAADARQRPEAVTAPTAVRPLPRLWERWPTAQQWLAPPRPQFQARAGPWARADARAQNGPRAHAGHRPDRAFLPRRAESRLLHGKGPMLPGAPAVPLQAPVPPTRPIVAPAS